MAGAGSILLLKHSNSPLTDYACQHLRARGFDIQLVMPYAGEPLPRRKPADLKGCLIYGGPASVQEPDRYPFMRHEVRWVEDCLAWDLPLAGICLGAQVIAYTLGADVGPAPDGRQEYGYFPIHRTEAGRDFLPEGFHGILTHYYAMGLPDGAEHLAASERFAVQAFRQGPRCYAMLFHPEWPVARPIQIAANLPPERRERDGVQSEAEMRAAAALHDAPQRRWLADFLDGLFLS